MQGFSPVVQGCGWKSHRGLVISRKQLGDANRTVLTEYDVYAVLMIMISDFSCS